MNTTLWLAVFAAMLAPMLSAGDLKSTLTELDIASIEDKATAMLLDLRKNAASPHEEILAALADLCDEQNTRSPKKSDVKRIMKEHTPASPLAFTRAISSPKLKPQAIKAN